MAHTSRRRHLITESSTALTEANLRMERQLCQVRDAVMAKWGTNPMTPDGPPACYIEATYDDHVVIEMNEKYFSVNYQISPDGVTFGEPSEVEETFVPVTASEALPYEGRILEAVGTSGREWDVVVIEAGISRNGIN